MWYYVVNLLANEGFRYTTLRVNTKLRRVLLLKRELLRRVLSLCIAVLLAVSCIACSAGCGQQPSQSTTEQDSAISQTAIEQDALPTTTGRSLNKFTLEATLNTDEHRLNVTQSLDYANNTGIELNEIYFNLIPNAFGKDGGGIVMNNISVGSNKLELERVKETVYKLSLPEALAANDRLVIQMNYTVNIPDICSRFGYQKTTYNVGNFIVTPAVYDANGWSVKTYVDVGDAFYTDIASYEVKLNVPEGYVVAATGEEIEAGLYRAENVRDFAFCASDGYDELHDTWNDTEITVYYTGDMQRTAQRALETAQSSLELFSDKFCDYPYSTLSVVMSPLDGGVGGMEYPTLVMIAPEMTIEAVDDMDLAVSYSDFIEMVSLTIDYPVCHEIAHQWFYCIVGNDQICEPWLDEGFCRFAEYLYLETHPVDLSDRSPYALKSCFNSVHSMLTGGEPENEFIGEPEASSLSKNLYYWNEKDPMEYGQIYDVGATLLYEMRLKMGAESFDTALKEYVDRFSFDFVTTEEFKTFWSQKSNFDDLFAIYLS